MRRFLLSAAKLAISVALLYFALRKTDFAELYGRLSAGSVGWLALGLALMLFQIVIAALRWQAISGDCGAPLSFGPAYRYYMIGTFFNQTLPSSIGGDAVRLWLVSRTGAGWRPATYSIFIDRAIGHIALAAYIFLALPWTFQLITDPGGRTGLAVLTALALGAGIGFQVIGALPFAFLRAWWPTRHIVACSRITNRAVFDGLRGVWIMMLSFAVHLAPPVMAWCVAQAIRSPATFGDLAVLIAPVMLITMMPISIAGWGVREATMGLAFGYAGLGEHEGVNVSLLFGAVIFMVGIVGGLIWVFSAEKAAKGDAPIEVPVETAPVDLD